MSVINTTVYGDKEQWTHLNTNTASQQYEIRGAYFGDTSTNAYTRNNLTLGVKNRYLSIGDTNIDNSLSVWGINKDCGLCNISLQAIYNPDNTTDDFKLESDFVPLTVSPATSKPLFLTGVNGTQVNAVTILPNTAWQTGYNYSNVPITSFNYAHTVIMCYLEVTDAINGNEYTQNPGVKYVQLGDYYSQNIDGVYTGAINPTTHPTILGGYFVTYYGYPYKAGTTTFYQPRQSLSSQIFSIALFDTFRDMSYLSTPTYIIKWDKNKTYPKAISMGNNQGGIGYCTCVFGQTIQLTNKSSFKNNLTESIQHTLTSNVSWQYNAKVTDRGKLFYYTIANSQNMFCGIDYSDMTKDEIYRQFAMLGFWFADYTTAANYAFCGEEIDQYTDVPPEYYDHLYIPVFDNNTVTTGDYYPAKSISAKEQPNYKWGDPHIDNTYNPEYKPDSDNLKPIPDKGYLQTKYNRNNYNAGNTIYVMDGATLQDVKNYVNAGITPPTDITDLSSWLDVDWYGQDPGDFILAVNRFPLEVPTNIYDIPGVDVVIGKNKAYKGLQTSPEYIKATQKRTNTASINFGTLNISAVNGNFLDYAPYATYQIYIPFVGTYTLDSKIWVGHNCTVILDYDLINCNAMCEIWRDDLWFDTIYGTFGTPVPFLTYNTGSYQNAIYNAQNALSNAKLGVVQSSLNAVTSVAGMGAGAVTGNTTMSIGTGLQLFNTITQPLNAFNAYDNAKYNLGHIAPQPTTTSGVGGISTKIANNSCILIATYSQPLSYKPSDYGKTYGYACCVTGNLSNFKGYTECGAVRFDNTDGMTKTEENIIKQMLVQGVIL